LEDVIGYLDSKGLHTKPAGKNNVHLACFYCDEADAKRGRLYINIDPDANIPGLHQCHLCGEKGSLVKIKRHFGDDVGKGSDVGEEHFDLLKTAADYFHSNLSTVPQVVNWLQADRGFTDSTIKKHRLGWGDPTAIPYLKSKGYSEDRIISAGLLDKYQRPFYDDVVTIPYFIGDVCVGIREKKLGGKYRQPHGWTQRIYNVDAVYNNSQLSDVVVTEGEFDCLISEQLGYVSVGVPGATQWQDSWNVYFKDVKRVWVVFDNDDAGRKGAEKIRESLGPKVKIANMPPGPSGDDDDGNDVSAWIVEQSHDAVDFAQHLRQRKESLILTVDDAVDEWRSVQGATGLKFGYERLDTLINPGLLIGQVCVVLAKTGSGKQEPVDSDIPTPSGFRKMGDLCVGDVVFGADGKPTRVLGVYPQGVHPIFRLTFSDGTSAESGGEHLWSVLERSGRKREWRVLTTLELLGNGLRHENGKEWRYTIPLVAPIEYPHVDLPIGPYTLGYLISNGSFIPSSYGYLISNGSFIPSSYLLASKEQRTDLLHGMFDGGTIVRRSSNVVDYCTSSHSLAHDVVELVSSLGGTACQRWTNRDGIEECQISIMLPETPSFWKRQRRFPRRSIVAIEYSRHAEAQCLRVEAEDSLYVTGHHYVVTHNTLWLLNAMQRMSMVPGQEEFTFLLCSLEQTRGDWFERAQRIFAFSNMNLAPLSSDPKELERFDRTILDATRNYWSNRLLLTDKNRIGLAELYETLDDYKDMFGRPPDCIAIDYLGYMARSSPGKDKYEKTSEAIMAVKELAKEIRVPILLPHQVSRGAQFGQRFDSDSARDSGAVEETADFVFSIYNPDHGKDPSDPKTGKLRCEILKSRHGGRGYPLYYQFAPYTLAFVPEGNPAEERMALNELKWGNVPWQVAMHSHRTGIGPF